MTQDKATQISTQLGDDVLQEIEHAFNQLRQRSGYGSIEITVHAGRVTQIERREKVRFELASQVTKPTVKTAAAN